VSESLGGSDSELALRPCNSNERNWEKEELMTDRYDRLTPLTRRGFLRAGTFFALLPSIRLTALSETIGKPLPGIGSERQKDAAQPVSPEWMKDLIIYEVATKGFTSPNGPESGTFASLESKLSYLFAIPTISTTFGRNML
jgi:hypothetical protein